ncbi:MAG TPA: prephenate dehydrogenase/arogenate dehydrogenase family protein, partial [Bacteroidia bacterium]|nr:prephenate dehydrogenase/arogenate dehydrogenase family protein [Bacteroidia bacterium]
CIIIAVPISVFKQVCESMKPHIKPGTIILDVCSVKEYPLEVIKEVLPEHAQNYIGTHPLFGLQSAPNSCAGQRVVICGNTGGPEAHIWAMSVFNKLKLNTIFCSAMEHDREMARTQVLDHFIGKGLVKAGIKRSNMSTVTHEKLMDIVDIVEGNTTQLFLDMNKYNKHTKEMRSELISKLDDLHVELSDNE